MTLEVKKSTYDTLVLAGGGIKGYSILGAIQAVLDEGFLEAENYIGTSVGAIISYLLIIGYSPIEIVVFLNTSKYLEKIPYLNLVNMLDGEGAIPYLYIQEILEKMTILKCGKYMTLGKLKETFNKNLICISYNATTCKTEYLSAETKPDLPCLVALRMSSNLPLVFSRFSYEECYYLDGGMTNNFPIQKGIEIGKKVLGINLEFPEKQLRDEPQDGLILYFLRLLQIQAVHALKSEIKENENLKIIRIKVDDIKHPLQFNISSKMKLELFSTGYNQAKLVMNIL